MKILIVIHSMRTGGAERVTANLANHWVSLGWEISILTFTGVESDFYRLDPLVSRYELNMAKESKLPIIGAFANIKRTMAIRSFVKAISPDIVLGVMTTSSVLSILACLGLRSKVVATEHTFPPANPVSKLWIKLRSMTFPFADQVVMLTSEGLSWLSENIPEAKGVVIPNPVQFPLPVYEPRIPATEFKKGSLKLILAVGRFDAGKQLDHGIKAFSQIAEKNPDWFLVILGDGPLRDDLELLIDKNNLSDRVFLPGRAGNIAEWYQAADIYIMTSKFEGFPNTIVEAMSYGCPAISYDCDTGPRDIIRDHVDGILVKPAEGVEGLANALNKLITNEEIRFSMKANAIKVRNRFSLESITRNWQEIFAKITTKKK